MTNPTEPFTPEQVTEAVVQAKDYWAANLAERPRREAFGYWLPFLLQRIAAQEAALQEVRSVGHNPDCIFCGFKDRAVNVAFGVEVGSG